MMTSNYAALMKITSPLIPVSISRHKPCYLTESWLARVAPGTVGRDFDALAPTWDALEGTEDEYNEAFAAQLAALDPAKVFADLGENAVLLCHCKPNVFCHRRLVAEWFEHHLGIIVPELGIDRAQTPAFATHHYPWSRS